ncbi:mechanosensitive ion channel family protein [Vibrio methylphosphonaticus]|uniref:mechanosensitive ion channel family protein n=1 Tax=Vibrio methylphosphonaticus TaxID=2946866 RepID=UPI00202A2FF0|nr:mechanosensitive ion channel family protein [Vibrio methylphosphonaticus]MCL9777205.1 mechanosensitive ion channel family protein [Vibrio methylphosphonaticus]
MNSSMDVLQNYIQSFGYDWLSNVLLITLSSFIAWVIWRVVYRRLEALAQHTHLEWDDLLIRAVRSPISALIWLWPATISIGLIVSAYSDTDNQWIEQVDLLLVIAAFIWISLGLIQNVETRVLAQKKRDETTVQAIAKVARLFFITIGVLTVMQSLGLSLSGLLTFGGVGGLIVGLAAKDLLSNFFGGMMIYFDRPFKVGDWIRSPDRNIEGTVERIGWRMTIIRTFDKRPLYVPNSVFSNIVVENPSRMLNRRIFETIGLRYADGDKVSVVVGEIKTMLENHRDIDSKQTLMVNFDSFGTSSLNFFVYAFTKTVNWARYHEVKQDVLLQIMAIIHKHDADIAYPTQTLKFDPSALSENPEVTNDNSTFPNSIISK